MNIFIMFGLGTDVRLMHCISQLVNQNKACTCPVSLALNYTSEPKGVANMWRRPMSRQQALPLALIGKGCLMIINFKT